MAVRRIGSDDDDDIGMLDAVEVLGAGRGAKGGAEAVPGRRVADPSACVDIVVSKRGPDELLDEKRLFIRAARRCYAADRAPPMLGLNPLELGGRITDGFVPAHFPPRVVDGLTDHWIEDAIL